MITQEWLDTIDLRKTDLHMHTVYCDGRNTPEEMVISAIDKGMSCIGFSGHSYVACDAGFGMDPETLAAYRQEIYALRERYSGKIQILCGIELDYHSEVDPDQNVIPGTFTGELNTIEELHEGFDYVIGSVHYIDTPEGLAAVDDTPERLQKAVEKYYRNDFYLAAEAYFELVSDVVHKTDCDIIGHFDLFSKFNEKKHFFDEEHPRYIAAWQKAADKLIPEGRIFEINTGAISRGHRSIPYPSPAMIDYIRERGGRVILSSDSHRCETIGYGFEQFADLICG